MSIICCVLFLIFFAIRTNQLLEGTGAILLVTNLTNKGEAFDLFKMGYYFAIEQIPAEVGTITLEAISYDGENNVERTSVIDFVDCDYYQKLAPEVSRLNLGSKSRGDKVDRIYLCPNTTSLLLLESSDSSKSKFA